MDRHGARRSGATLTTEVTARLLDSVYNGWSDKRSRVVHERPITVGKVTQKLPKKLPCEIAVMQVLDYIGVPKGIRTPVTAVKGSSLTFRATI